MINKWLKKIKNSEREIIEMQKNCKHDYKKVLIEIDLKKSYSLFGVFLGDVTGFSFKTEGFVCLECKKKVLIDIDVD